MKLEKNPIRSTTVVLAVSLIIIVQSIALFSCPGADPLGQSESFIDVSEGYWYLSQARAWLYGHEDGTPDAYRYPLLSLAQYSLLSFTGLSSRTAALPVGLAGLAVTIVLLLLTFRRFGPRAALLVGWLICLEPFFNEQARRPHPYPLIALWILIAFAIGCAESRRRRLGGVAMLVIGALWLHPLCGLAVPWVVYTEVDRWSRSEDDANRWHRWAPLGVSTAVGVGAALWFVQRLGLTVEFKNIASFQMVACAPIVMLWGSVGAILGWVEPARLKRDADFDRASAGTVSAVWFMLAVTGSSGAAYAVTIPFLVHHSTVMTERVLGWAEFGTRARLTSRLALGAMGVGIVGTLFCASLIIVEDLDTSVRLATGVAVVGVLFTLLLARLPKTVRTGWCSGGAVALAGAIWVPTWLLMFGGLTYSHANSSRQLRAVLLPMATLAGPSAAAMGVDNELALRRGASSSRDSSHWISDLPPGQLPADLSFVEVFHPLSHPIRVYRVLESDLQMSAFEDAVSSARVGENERAEEMFFAVLKGFEDTGCAWTRLGMLFHRAGNAAGAYQCFLHAIQGEPSRVGAHVALASLYIADGRVREATSHLQQALDHEPTNEYLRREVERLRALSR